MKRYFAIVFFILTTFDIFLCAQSSKSFNQGVEAYENGNFEQAESLFEKSTKDPKDKFKSKYNQGLAQSQQKKYKDAAESFKNAESSTQDKYQKSKAAFNRGNALRADSQQKEALQSYKDALKSDPTMRAAIDNLYKMKREKYKQQNQQKQQNQNKQNQNKPNEPQDQKQNDQQDKSSKQQADKNTPQTIDDKQSTENKSTPQNEPSKDGAKNQQMPDNKTKQILDEIDEKDRKVHEKLRRGGKSRKPLKDW